MNQAQTQARLVEDAFKDMLSADDFKSAFRNHPAGVSVVTADPGDGPVGLTATSVISVSANPPAPGVFAFGLFLCCPPCAGKSRNGSGPSPRRRATGGGEGLRNQRH